MQVLLRNAYNKKYISGLARKFQQCTGAGGLAQLLHKQIHQLQLLAAHPQYNVFQLPKKDGSFRSIEDPAGELKKVQRSLNTYLQAVYYFIKPVTAYGFIINLKNDADKRNIYTNAQKHCGSTFLLNVDLEDFFHSVLYQTVLDIFQRQYFSFNNETCRLLAGLTTHAGRLPVGAPTSPVLSNFACLQMDGELQAFALRNNLCFTRFADDMSFSGNSPLAEKHFNEIESIISSHRFRINSKKIKWYGPADIKSVTGLVINHVVSLPPGYLQQLQQQVQHYRSAWCVKKKYSAGFAPAHLKELKKELEGRLAFAEMVEGENNSLIHGLRQQLYNAEQDAEEYCSVSWNDLPYYW